jgi:hypothetical protein
MLSQTYAIAKLGTLTTEPTLNNALSALMPAKNAQQQLLLVVCVIRALDLYLVVNGALAISTFMIIIPLWFAQHAIIHVQLVQISLIVQPAIRQNLEYLIALINIAIAK